MCICKGKGDAAAPDGCPSVRLGLDSVLPGSWETVTAGLNGVHVRPVQVVVCLLLCFIEDFHLRYSGVAGDLA